MTRYADKTRHSDKMTMILTDMKMNSELFLCASDLNMCRKVNVSRLNMKTVRKNKMKFFQSMYSNLIIINVIALLAPSELMLKCNS